MSYRCDPLRRARRCGEGCDRPGALTHKVNSLSALRPREVDRRDHGSDGKRRIPRIVGSAMTGQVEGQG